MWLEGTVFSEKERNHTARCVLLPLCFHGMGNSNLHVQCSFFDEDSALQEHMILLMHSTYAASVVRPALSQEMGYILRSA